MDDEQLDALLEDRLRRELAGETPASRDFTPKQQAAYREAFRLLRARQPSPEEPSQGSTGAADPSLAAAVPSEPEGRSLVVRPLQSEQERLDFQQNQLRSLLQRPEVATINGLRRHDLAALFQDALTRHQDERKALGEVHERLDAAYKERRAELEAQQWRERERQELEQKHRSLERKPPHDRSLE